MLLRLFQKRRLFHKETRLCYVDENFEVPVNAELSKEMLMFVTYIRSQDKSFFKDLIESIPNKRGAYKELYEHANRQLEHLAPGFDEVLVAEIYRSLKKDQKEKWNKKLYDHFETNAAFAENVPSAIDETRNIANEILQNSSIEQRLLKARAEVKELVNETDKTNAQFEKLFIDRVTEEEKQTIDKDQLSLSDIQTLEEKIKALNIDLDNPGEFFDVEELKWYKNIQQRIAYYKPIMEAEDNLARGVKWLFIEPEYDIEPFVKYLISPEASSEVKQKFANALNDLQNQHNINLVNDISNPWRGMTPENISSVWQALSKQDKEVALLAFHRNLDLNQISAEVSTVKKFNTEETEDIKKHLDAITKKTFEYIEKTEGLFAALTQTKEELAQKNTEFREHTAKVGEALNSAIKAKVYNEEESIKMRDHHRIGQAIADTNEEIIKHIDQLEKFSKGEIHPKELIRFLNTNNTTFYDKDGNVIPSGLTDLIEALKKTLEDNDIGHGAWNNLDNEAKQGLASKFLDTKEVKDYLTHLEAQKDRTADFENDYNKWAGPLLQELEEADEAAKAGNTGGSASPKSRSKFSIPMPGGARLTIKWFTLSQMWKGTKLFGENLLKSWERHNTLKANEFQYHVGLPIAKALKTVLGKPFPAFNYLDTDIINNRYSQLNEEEKKHRDEVLEVNDPSFKNLFGNNGKGGDFAKAVSEGKQHEAMAMLKFASERGLLFGFGTKGKYYSNGQQLDQLFGGDREWIDWLDREHSSMASANNASGVDRGIKEGEEEVKLIRGHEQKLYECQKYLDENEIYKWMGAGKAILGEVKNAHASTAIAAQWFRKLEMDPGFRNLLSNAMIKKVSTAIPSVASIAPTLAFAAKHSEKAIIKWQNTDKPASEVGNFGATYSIIKNKVLEINPKLGQPGAGVDLDIVIGKVLTGSVVDVTKAAWKEELNNPEKSSGLTHISMVTLGNENDGNKEIIDAYFKKISSEPVPKQLVSDDSWNDESLFQEMNENYMNSETTFGYILINQKDDFALGKKAEFFAEGLACRVVQKEELIKKLRSKGEPVGHLEADLQQYKDVVKEKLSKSLIKGSLGGNSSVKFADKKIRVLDEEESWTGNSENMYSLYYDYGLLDLGVIIDEYKDTGNPSAQEYLEKVYKHMTGNEMPNKKSNSNASSRRRLDDDGEG